MAKASGVRRWSQRLALDHEGDIAARSANVVPSDSRVACLPVQSRQRLTNTSTYLGSSAIRGQSVAAQRGELVGGDAPALVNAHPLIGGVVLGISVAYPGGVARLTTFIFKGEDAREEGRG